MRLESLLLMIAGWMITISAIAWLPSPPARGSFLLAGIGVELLGLALAVRFHLAFKVEKGG